MSVQTNVQTKCKSCASAQIQAMGERDGYAIVRCQACGLMFVPDTPSQTELIEFYKHDKLDKWERNQSVDLGAFGEQFISTPSSKRDWFDKVLRETESLAGKTRLKILEIGSPPRMLNAASPIFGCGEPRCCER